MCLVEATVSQRRLEGLDASASARNPNISRPDLPRSSPLPLAGFYEHLPPNEGVLSSNELSNNRVPPPLSAPVVPFDSYSRSASNSASFKPPNASKFALPSKKVADMILEKFVNNLYALYPILHLPTFFEHYNAMWTEGCTNDFYILINLAFTLGSLMLDGHDSNSYFLKVAPKIDDLVLKWAIHDPNANSLLSLQCLFYSSLCLLVRQKVAACCNVLSLVSRYASQLYQHRYEITKDEDKEIFSRLYYSCTIFDCVVACLFGKPLALTKISRVPLPTFEDFEIDMALFPTKEIRDTTTKDLTFFKHNCAMSIISSKVVQTLYDNGANHVAKGTTSELEIIKFILEIECELTEFENSISDYYKLPAAKDDLPLLKRTYVIQIRRLSLKILAYRPILLPLVSGSQSERLNSPLMKSIKSSISQLCIEAALELIDFVWETGDSFIMPSFWYTIFYIYNAAIVVLAALISKDVFDVDIMTLEASWDRALALLQSFVKHSETAIKCIKSLQDVHAKVMASNEVMLDIFYEGI